MDDLLLREICRLAGVTRRAVQGYEKLGLVSPAGKNKMGHLLYDESALEIIKEIKRFQKRGFSLQEIKTLEAMSEKELQETIEIKIAKLKEKHGEIDESILFLESVAKKI